MNCSLNPGSKSNSMFVRLSILGYVMARYFRNQEGISGSRVETDRVESFEYTIGFTTEDDMCNPLSNQRPLRQWLAKCVPGLIGL